VSAFFYHKFKITSPTNKFPHEHRFIKNQSRARALPSGHLAPISHKSLSLTQKPQTMKHCKILLNLSALSALGLFVGCEKKVSDKAADITATAASSKQSVLDKTTCLLRLKSNSLLDSCARSILTLNEWRFEILAENNPDELTNQLNQLAKLGKHPATWSVLERQPEIASLLALSLQYEKNGPAKLAAVFARAPDQSQLFKNFCHLNTLDIQNCLETVETYERFGDILARLAKQGILSVEDCFHQLPRNADARECYVRWVREFLCDALDNGDEETLKTKLEERLAWLQTESFEFRELLDENNDFRIHFSDKYAPALQRVAEHYRELTDITGILRISYIWETLQLSEGERILKNYGLYAPSILEKFAAPEHSANRKMLVTAMLRNDETGHAAIETLLTNINDPSLKNFVDAKHIPEITKIEILAENADNPNASTRFRYFTGLSKEALMEDRYEKDSFVDDIPFVGSVTSTCKVIKKMCQGREYTVLEIAAPTIGAALDAATVVSVVGTAGVATVGIGAANVAIKSALKQGAKTVVRRNGINAAKQLAKNGIKNTASRGIKTGFDITKITQDAFQPGRRVFGIKAGNFKKMFGNLDARIFMRGDRKVLLQIPGLKNLGYEIAFDGTLTAGTDTPTGEKIIATIKSKFSETPRKIELSPEQYTSALWLDSATGNLQKHLGFNEL
jgi:hypothetical protein